MTPARTRGILVALVIVVIILAAHFLLQTGIVKSSCIGAKSVSTEYGVITICTSLPPTPENVTLYRVVPQENDFAYFSVDDSEKTRKNVTTDIDAPTVARKALEKYGGLPEDAMLVYNQTEYLEQRRSSRIPLFPSELIAKYSILTNVQYSRKINGVPVVGPGGFINIEIGDFGELLYLNKIWRTVEPAGTAKIIPASAAIEKMARGEVFGSRLKCICDLNVDKIGIAYYEKDSGESQEYLEPVWVFAGTLAPRDGSFGSGDRGKYYVPAREGSTLEIPEGLSTPRTGFAAVALQNKTGASP
jgi:hypothetical protein